MRGAVLFLDFFEGIAQKVGGGFAPRLRVASGNDSFRRVSAVIHQYYSSSVESNILIEGEE